MANLYEAMFQDPKGRSFPARLRCATDTAAKVIANAMALKSDAKWTELKKIAKIALPVMDGETDLTPNQGQAAGVNSDVQKKGRLIYNSATGGDHVTVEIGSVKSAYLAPGDDSTEHTSTDPLDNTTRAYLLTEAGNSVTAFGGGSFHRKIRKA